MRKLIRGGTVVSATGSSLADVLVDGEEVVAVGALGDVDAEIVDASGCYVLPGLIVMGLYGHSRLREMVLGGASRTLLASMTVPVFMSH